MEEEVLGKAYDGRLMRRLLRYMRPYWKLIAASLAFLVLQASLQVMGPLLTKTAVDKYLDNSGTTSVFDPWLPSDPRAGLARIALIYFAVLLGNFVAEFTQTYLMQYTGQLAMFDLRREIMAHMCKSSTLRSSTKTPVGRLVTRVTTDVDVLNDLFTSGLVAILGDALTLTFIIAVMFNMRAPMLTGIELLAMLLRHSGHQHFPAHGTRKLPPHPSRHCAHQLVPAGAHHGDGGAATLQPRKAQHRSEFAGGKSRAYGGLQGRDHGIRMVLSGSRVSLYDRDGEHPDVWRLSHPRRRADAGHSGRVPAIRAEILPADSGFEREVQHPAGRDGVVGARLQTARYAGVDRTLPRRQQARRERSPQSSSTRSWFAYNDEDWCCAT